MAENSGADGFAPLRVKRVVRETSDAVSLVLDVPERCSARYRYQAGQFLTLRVTVDGQDLRRCYSMSSAPLEDDLQITIKRDPGGVVSNWLNDTVSEGIEIHAAPPEGRFCLRDTTDEIVAFAGGSGITPIMSLVRTALASSSRRIRVFYANRCRDSVIFADALSRLADEHADRLVVVHHIDDDSGVVTPPVVESFVADTGAATTTSVVPARSWTPSRLRFSSPVSRGNAFTSNAFRSSRLLPTSPTVPGRPKRW